MGTEVCGSVVASPAGQVQGPDDNNFGSRSTHKTAFCEQNFTKY